MISTPVLDNPEAMVDNHALEFFGCVAPPREFQHSLFDPRMADVATVDQLRVKEALL
jgi:hypothetical protein